MSRIIYLEQGLVVALRVDQPLRSQPAVTDLHIHRERPERDCVGAILITAQIAAWASALRKTPKFG